MITIIVCLHALIAWPGDDTPSREFHFKETYCNVTATSSSLHVICRNDMEFILPISECSVSKFEEEKKK
jgi:hypothetical protein